MAQAQKKSFGPDTVPGAHPQDAAPAALAQNPFAFWSNMADMQRQFLTSMVKAPEPASAAGPNVAEIRPSALAEPVAKVSQNWMAAASECQREMAGFVNERLAKNQAFITKLVAAHDMPELIQLHAGWMQQTAQDYTDEIGRLSDIVKNGADEAIAATA
ncbi:MAG: hypothetical protein JWN07_2006 [Hyphomicrobiales bacterium]|nr:hypothetical protein [Hyphomicrobiales bacterium]